MNDDELLPIGRFAREAGLTVGALRHYDEEDAVRPAAVDPDTGYRRYRRDQLPVARAVAALRELELGLPAIRALLAADDPAARATILADERLRLQARTARLQRALHRLNMLEVSADGRGQLPRTSAVPIASVPQHTEDLDVPTPPSPPELDRALERALAAGLFNRTWDYLEREARSERDDAEMIDIAHASAWHWRQVGTAANEARAHGMLARVYSTLGHADEAVYHAARANAVLDEGGEGIEDWDGAAAAEAMARALVATGDLAGAADWKAKATALLAGIANPEERRIVEADLATLPV